MMNEYKSVFFKYIKYTLYLLSLFFVGYAVTPYKAIFLGLALGTVFSLYNLWSMYSKIDRMGQAVIQQKRVKTLGSLSRLLFAGLAVLIAMKYPEHFHLLSVVVGLMSVYIIMLIDSLTQVTRTPKEKR
ncbi:MULTISPECIES: ATP synthase subunit I [Fictibacillus]|jgi:ATP synthase protein I|uniref:ATP synthase subunit I n=1 Tax=Fictibacillus norfolkensis TaxID=2762233 RepID=A0ABR8SNN0_9BACL|nr:MULTISPECIES: ATP synthase subunit I [Fictibacillus]MBD7965067.1 ATP synthase subunit I [Fictibacillus norfolkensis]MBH0164406.1 ATP synthase subunit I [Fictibacillus sp. 7GRE50]MBH0175610.1 ATP synthase subunit I [Fictibacillus sp. 23RED33]